MLLVLNKILSMKFGNDFLEKKNDLVFEFIVCIILLQQQKHPYPSNLGSATRIPTIKYLV